MARCPSVSPLRKRAGRSCLTRGLMAMASALLLACQGGQNGQNGQSGTDLPAAQSTGQVTPATAAPKVSYFAASRFAEQVAFGPTPALVAELRASGFEAWIDRQFAMPLVPIDLKPAEAVYAVGPNDRIPEPIWTYLEREFMARALTAPDQLRWRVVWSLSQVIVATRTASSPPAEVTWVNLLYRQALGRYGELLREASTNRLMGWYLNNDQNRPKSSECPHCAPNENYARELMQLFSIGVFQLNPDGTPQRDSRGRLVESYTQTDVEELARALTGWMSDPNPSNRPPRNWANWTKPMVPSTWAPERDSGAKQVLGRTLPAGQGQAQDLDDVVNLLMAHPNIAPFVATRLIQHLVKSDPSPDYIGRVAARFRNNGSSVAGDLKAVVKAILLDPEARRGDEPTATRVTDGKFREPWLHRTGLFRGLGCLHNIVREPEPKVWYWILGNQRPFYQDSVFSFYAPTDRAPKSNLLAPEQRLVDALELTDRLSEMNRLRWTHANQANDMQILRDAGCQVDEWVAAYASSPKAFLDLLSARYFRGAMSTTLRFNLEQMILSPTWNPSDPSEGAMRMLGFALATPQYGVIK